MSRQPRDTSKYITPAIAAGRLINLALTHVLFVRDGVKVRWELKLSYYHTADYKDSPNAKVRVQSGTFSSGEDVQEDVSEALAKSSSGKRSA